MQTDVFNIHHKKVSAVEVPDAVFGVSWNADLVHQVTTSQLANERAPFAHVKDRSETSGGGKKPWRQKHTGRARHGSSRSPIWVGGGITHGPRNERDFSKKINKKMRKAALFAVLSKKMKDGEIFVIDALSFGERKTKHVAAFLKAFTPKPASVVLIPKKGNVDITLAGRNIPKTLIVPDANSLDAYECLSHKYLFFEKDAVEEMKHSVL